ncbi:hypothetical protein [Microbacterium sp. NPDC078849]|uniref:hypothetical protein n=1 Tax=unclassified Microbacterium TaxID=2609290 RepID=UPI00344DC3E5
MSPKISDHTPVHMVPSEELAPATRQFPVDLPPDETTGYLVSKDGVLHVQCQRTTKGNVEAFTLPWADFDLEPLGRVVEAGGVVKAYLALLRTTTGVHSVVLTPELLSDEKKLRPFLAPYEASWNNPSNVSVAMLPGVRMLRFLKTNTHGSARVVEHLGWDEASRSFVTFSGVIRPDGHHDGWEESVGVVADPRLQTLGAEYEYGFEGDFATAREVVREVLTFHDEETMAVFGSWWAACFLKPQTMQRTALFPFMALEAHSGSAKTTGAFGDLLQLSGSNTGHELSTTASFRDKVSVNRSGIVWNDDANDLAALDEILRGATMGVTANKKRNDNTTTARIGLVAPILLSGEGLGIQGQKALTDRAILLSPPPVTGRTSRKSGREGEPQWGDVTALRRKHGNLTKYAGWLVQFALAHSDQYLTRLTEAQKRYSGRYGDNLAVVSAGAWLLDEIAGTGTWAQDAVATWCEEKDGEYLPGENSLTETVIPWALEQFGLPVWHRGTKAPTVRSFGQEVAPGVMMTRTDVGTLTEVTTLWVNTARLAHLWSEHHKAAKERTETTRALQGQVTAVTGPREEWAKAKFADGQKEYRPLLPAYARRVLAGYEGGGER